MFFLDPISRAGLSTCLLWINTPVQPLLDLSSSIIPLVSRDYLGSSRNTIFYAELSLRWFPCLIIPPRTTSLVSSLCRAHGSDNLLLHHSFDLMSSLIGYIWMKSLDNCVVMIINILSSSRISIEFMMRNTILALDELCYHRPLYCLPLNTNLFMFCVIPWDPCYPAFVIRCLGVLPSFMSRRLWEFHHLLRILDIVILLAISIHILLPVLFLNRIPAI